MIKPLTSLRFFAALAVYIEHLGTDSDTGGLGVIFFFILSGFIITYTYSEKIKTLKPMEVLALYIKRAGRIFPVHIFTFLLAIPLIFIKGDVTTLSAAISNLFLVHAWYPSAHDFFSLNSVSWTLSVEWAFYLAFPFILISIKKVGFNKTAAGGIWLAGIFIAAFLAVSMWIFRDPALVERSTWLIRISPLNALIFIIGIGIGLHMIKEKSSAQISITTATILEVIILLLIAAVYTWDVVYQAKKIIPFDHAIIYMPLFAFSIYIFTVAKGYISKILSNPVLVHLGNLSFSIYMVHLLAIIYSQQYWLSVVGVNGGQMNRIYLFIAIIAASEIIYWLIENPYRVYAKQAAGKITSAMVSF